MKELLFEYVKLVDRDISNKSINDIFPNGVNSEISDIEKRLNFEFPNDFRIYWKLVMSNFSTVPDELHLLCDRRLFNEEEIFYANTERNIQRSKKYGGYLNDYDEDLEIQFNKSKNMYDLLQACNYDLGLADEKSIEGIHYENISKEEYKKNYIEIANVSGDGFLISINESKNELIVVQTWEAEILAPSVTAHFEDLIFGIKNKLYSFNEDGILMYPASWYERQLLRTGKYLFKCLDPFDEIYCVIPNTHAL